MKTPAMFISALLLTLGLSACGGSDLNGTWANTQTVPLAGSMTTTLTIDGESFELDVTAGKTSMMSASGDLSVDGDQLTMQVKTCSAMGIKMDDCSSAPSTTGTYKIDGDKLTINGDDTEVYTRQ